jgi:TPP-dependent pyruvate/acetoin dehydrogenase alpha subunit
MLDHDRMQAMHDEVKTEVEEAIAAAWDAPDPDPATVLGHVFAEDGS